MKVLLHFSFSFCSKTASFVAGFPHACGFLWIAPRVVFTYAFSSSLYMLSFLAEVLGNTKKFKKEASNQQRNDVQKPAVRLPQAMRKRASPMRVK